MTIPDEILIIPSDVGQERRPDRSRVAAFVPIAVALIGVVIVLVGGVSARSLDSGARDTDPMITGSIAPASQTELR